MTNTPEELMAQNQENLRTMEALAVRTYAGLERLVDLNLTACKTLFAESFSHAKSLLEAKDPQQLLTLQTGFFQPMAEKSATYGRDVYAVVNEIGAEFTRIFETKLTETQGSLNALVENHVKNAPTGTEAAVAAFKNAVNASQNVIESAQSSAKKALEVAESNFSTASSSQAAYVATTESASKKR